MTSRPTTQRSTRSLAFPSPITLPVVEDPQVVDEDGYEVVQPPQGQDGQVRMVNADGEEEEPAKVLSIAERYVRPPLSDLTN